MSRYGSFDQRRLLVVALGLCIGAAGCERTAGRRREEIGWTALDRVETGVAGIADPRDGAEERLGIGHGHLREEDAGRSPFDHVAGVHDDDLVRARGHDAKVVGHQDHAHVPITLQGAQQSQDLGLHGDVESGGGLVGHEQPRRACQSDGDDHPLAHASRELVRVGAEAFGRGRDADLRQEGQRRLLRLGPVEVEMDLERLGDLVADPLDRVERCHRVLEDHGDLGSPEVAQVLG